MKAINKFFSDVFKVWKNEFRPIFKDKGILIFLFLVPLAYPIVYALIYNPELSRDVPVAIVDLDRSDKSRDLCRMIDASESTEIAGYAADMQEARRMLDEKKAYGIVRIESDFSKQIARGEQSAVTLFCDMSLLIRYKSMLIGLTDATMAMGGKIQVETMSALGAEAPKIPATVASSYVPLGNPEQGFATFLLPGILVLIVQQTLLLAICMNGGAIYEHRRRYGGMDPFDTVRSGAVSRLLGKALAYLTVYIIPLLYLLVIMPWVFSYPQLGDLLDIVLLAIPYILAVSFFGMSLQVFVREREASFVVIVFTSVIFLFLSGIPWPIYDMPAVYKFVGGCCPSTWAMQAFVRMNANGATLADVATEYRMLWLCAIAYFFIALAVNKFSRYGMFFRRHSSKHQTN